MLKDFYVMGKVLIGGLSCPVTGLVEGICQFSLPCQKTDSGADIMASMILQRILGKY